MPSLRLRAVGMSYAIEGATDAGLDGDALCEALQSRHGLAVAAIGIPAETILIDHKAESWDGLRAWLETWVLVQGGTEVAWEEHAPPHGEPAVDTLNFEI